MCIDPASIGISLSTLFQAIGVGASVVGTVVSASANAQAAEAAAEQDRRNAIIAQRNAEDARTRGIAAEQDVQLRTRARIGMQKNVLSERNISLSSGTALDVLGDTAMFGKLDALTTRGNFEREAIAHETQSMNFNAQAEQNTLAASAYRTSGGITAFSTALGGTADLLNTRRQMRL